jgi:hypothetical protein
VTVSVAGAPRDDLRITVRDTGAARDPGGAPAAGFGLLGLAERVAVAGESWPTVGPRKAASHFVRRCPGRPVLTDGSR